MRLALVVLAALVTCSCAPTRTFYAVPLPAEEVVRRARERSKPIQVMEAEGTLTVETPEQSGTMNVELQLIRPDTLWIRLSGPFGISVGTMLLSHEESLFYFPRERRILRRGRSREGLSTMFNLKLSFGDIMDAVTGSFLAFDKEDVLMKEIRDRRFYVIDSGGGKQQVWIDGESFVVTQFVQYDSDNKPVFIGSASRIEEIGGVYLPHLVRVILPKQRQSVTLAYSSVQINGNLEREFSIPYDAADVIVDTTR